MKLWVETGLADSAGRAVRAKVSEVMADINRKVVSRGVQAVNAIRSAEKEVLKGKRSGKVYRKPYTKATYTASASGEPPALRTGNLRMHWNDDVKARETSGGTEVIAVLESGEKYASVLETGTKDGKLKPRPFVEKIKEEAMPEIKKIYSGLYK